MYIIIIMYNVSIIIASSPGSLPLGLVALHMFLLLDHNSCVLYITHGSGHTLCFMFAS